MFISDASKIYMHYLFQSSALNRAHYFIFFAFCRLLQQEDETNTKTNSEKLINNPAVASVFFHIRIQKFVKFYYQDILGAQDYWFRYEWQHRGSVHVHGMAWLKGAPRAENLLHADPVIRQATIDEVSFLLQYLNSINLIKAFITKELLTMAENN